MAVTLRIYLNKIPTFNQWTNQFVLVQQFLIELPLIFNLKMKKKTNKNTVMQHTDYNHDAYAEK